MIGPADAETFSRCIAVGGVAVFPADTVYGLACEPDNREAVTQLYFLKRRRPEKPAAVMFFDLDLALEDSVVVVEWGEGVAERLAPSWLHVCLDRPGGADSAEESPRIARVEAHGPRWRDQIDA